MTSPRRVPDPSARLSLAERARIAAAQREPDPTGLEDPRWRDQAATHAHVIAGILGLDPLCVRYRRDPHRNYASGGYWPGVLLHVNDPADPTQTLQVIPDLAGAYLLLSPCPQCGQPTPAVRLAELADLAAITPTPTGTVAAPAIGRPRDFHGDPAHLPGCRYQPDTATTAPGGSTTDPAATTDR
ncbi:MAG: hypothetical protein L0Y54_13510 [Sporichthyaceae bacterium]|nr:hypothetical protein [Sporichthyaceae bacterium]